MTREEAIEKFEHTVTGMIHDAWSTNRSGKDHSIYLRRVTPSVQALLAQVFDLGYQSATQDAEKLAKPGGKRGLFKGKESEDDNAA